MNNNNINIFLKGSNKYYKIQIQTKMNRDFRVFFEWARVGAKNPQQKYEDYENKIEAILAFKKKFADKTHNDWNSRHNFKQQPVK